jgi:hypothetical protein
MLNYVIVYNYIVYYIIMCYVVVLVVDSGCFNGEAPEGKKGAEIGGVVGL